jgi:hypothetical protein
MTAWCDSSTIDAFLPRVAEQIEKLATGKPRYAQSGEGAVTSTAFAESI